MTVGIAHRMHGSQAWCARRLRSPICMFLLLLALGETRIKIKRKGRTNFRSIPQRRSRRTTVGQRACLKQFIVTLPFVHHCDCQGRGGVVPDPCNL
ncbi:hypothetical protein BD310DRAFT_597177 [Dichomitus squalens]|uniref:Uncharacterized protein n=1 Tax=Dichomitus squalens TaxID=114155 RepID=A0A4Q9PQX0_9APHY|nr:hypothetical protein BD310DRAFT_597177 [Dichomitus squalens]